jgi:hypothetical protein
MATFDPKASNPNANGCTRDTGSGGSRWNDQPFRDGERLCTTSEAWIYVAMIRLMAKRLARS